MKLTTPLQTTASTDTTSTFRNAASSEVTHVTCGMTTPTGDHATGLDIAGLSTTGLEFGTEWKTRARITATVESSLGFVARPTTSITPGVYPPGG